MFITFLLTHIYCARYPSASQSPRPPSHTLFSLHANHSPHSRNENSRQSLGPSMSHHEVLLQRWLFAALKCCHYRPSENPGLWNSLLTHFLKNAVLFSQLIVPVIMKMTKQFSPKNENPEGSKVFFWMQVYAQVYPTLCDPMGCSPPGSSVHGILQARILAWVAMPPPWDLPHSGIEPPSLVSPALAGDFIPTALPGKPSFKILARYMQFLHQPLEGHNNTLLIHWAVVYSFWRQHFFKNFILN